MGSPNFPRTAALLEPQGCPLEKFDELFAALTQARRASDGYFVQSHADETRLLFVVSGVPYGAGLLAGEERRFLDIREFFAAYRRDADAPLSFFAADKRLLLGLMVCFQHRPARLFTDGANGDAVLNGLEAHGGSAVLCLRGDEDWGITLCASGRPVANYFPPAGTPALEMGTTPAEQLQAYLVTLSPLVELYTETRVDPAADLALVATAPRGALSRCFLDASAPFAAEPARAEAVPEPPAAAPAWPGEAGEAPPSPEVEIEAPPDLEPEAWAPPSLEPAVREPEHVEPAPAKPEPLPGATAAPSAAPGQGAPELHLFVGERQMGTFSLAAGEVTVGRTPGNTIVIENPGVSRRHAVIRLEDERPVLEDLGSANGTYVNGQRVGRHELSDGDEIAIVKHRLIFRVPRGGEQAVKVEPLLDGQKTMFIEAPAVQAGGRQPGRGDSATPVLRPRLILPDRKLSLDEQREVTLGSGADCQVPLSGMFVARLHARIVAQKDGQYRLVHVAGLAGTRVNGAKISEHVLKHGDEIEIAKQKILFRLER